MSSELRRRFQAAPPEIQEKILRELTKILMKAADEKRAEPANVNDGDDVKLDREVWGSVFDGEGE